MVEDGSEAGRGGRWTKTQRELFLERFADGLDERRALAEVGMSEASLTALRRRDEPFAARYRAVLEGAYEHVEAALLALTLGKVPEKTEGGFDAALALKLLQMRHAEARGGRAKPAARATQEETDAALMKKLDALERWLKGAA
ncbi:MAG: hypothetical protein ACTHMG_01660 [Sphingomonas sp.]